MVVKMNSNGEQVTSYSEILGQFIKQRRIELGLSQEELANKVGYTSENSRATIGKIESGKQDVTVTKLRLFAKVLDVDIETLVTLDKSPSLGEQAYNKIIHYSDKLDKSAIKRLSTYFQVLADKE